MFYRADTDVKIRAAGGGRRSLDDLVLTVLDRQRAGDKVGVPEWLDLVTEELGERARGLRRDGGGGVGGARLRGVRSSIRP